MNLIQAFRSAMTVVSNQQSSPQNSTQNNIQSIHNVKANLEEDTESNNSRDGYAMPLGVSESMTNENNTEVGDGLSAGEIGVIAAAVMTSGAAVSYALFKEDTKSQSS